MAATGFTTMAGAKIEQPAPEIGVGMLGYAFIRICVRRNP